ncbi:DUF3298 domain-containing protein [Paenibacillus sp. PDC88]|uniref:DUF3298 domain-containing protein n=1 Tax=Paenibacillus sp. PDC88 TaxID=1884375 RepID=UPI0008981B3A|nr:DUF3298 domain-containing protein [Paenibacillus sp. PDC88]SDX04394.1 hypothetical protein SAMN05518848_104170 [Paenibacillus sp. PDC88]
MKRIVSYLSTFLILCLFLNAITLTSASAASGKVSLKAEYYKGHPYVKLVNFSNKKVSDKINLELKKFAVKSASISNSKEFKQEGYYYNTRVSTAYNKNNKLSVMFYTTYTTGGLSSLEWSDSFNYDMSTGKRIYLTDILNTRSKQFLFNQHVKETLNLLNTKTGAVFDTNKLANTKTQSFFYNDQGVTIRFNPNEVAYANQGYVDVVVPYNEIEGQGLAETGTNNNHSNTNTEVPSTLNINPSDVHIYSNDGETYLGSLSTNTFNSDSIFNQYGTYGSQYSIDSIWNEYGTYGSDYSLDSAFNQYTTTPPIIVYYGKVVGYVTTNQYLKNAVHPDDLLAFAQTLLDL